MTGRGKGGKGLGKGGAKRHRKVCNCCWVESIDLYAILYVMYVGYVLCMMVEKFEEGADVYLRILTRYLFPSPGATR